MAKTDWNITGTGGIGIVEDSGSKRCRLSASKLMLWNGNLSLTDCEIIADIQVGNDTNTRGGLILQSDSSGLTCYRLRIYGQRTYYIQKIQNGIITTLATVVSTRAWNEFVKTRFRIDGFQLSVEEWNNGQWNLIQMVQDTECSIASGQIGLYGESINSNYFISFDNVSINRKQ